MEINTYIPDSNKIVHTTQVDFVRRNVNNPIYLVQYDTNIPIIKMDLFNNAEKYTIPENAIVNIRWPKRDGTYVYKRVLGCDPNRNSVYIDVDTNMSVIPGTIYPIIELIINNGIAGSQNFKVAIERNAIDIITESSISDFSALEARIAVLEAIIAGRNG